MRVQLGTSNREILISGCAKPHVKFPPKCSSCRMVFDAEDAVGVSVRLGGVEALLEERDDLREV